MTFRILILLYHTLKAVPCRSGRWWQNPTTFPEKHLQKDILGHRHVSAVPGDFSSQGDFSLGGREGSHRLFVWGSMEFLYWEWPWWGAGMKNSGREAGVYTEIVRGRVEHQNEWDEGTGAEQRGRASRVNRINIGNDAFWGELFSLPWPEFVAQGLFLQGSGTSLPSARLLASTVPISILMVFLKFGLICYCFLLYSHFAQ